jgi:hypothetical protein
MARKRQRFEVFSGFWNRRWEVARGHRVGESRAGVAAVAKGLVGGLPAAAQPDRRSPRQTESGPGRIDNFEIALNAEGTVAVDGNFGGRHEERVAGKREKSKKRPPA